VRIRIEIPSKARGARIRKDSIQGGRGRSPVGSRRRAPRRPVARRRREPRPGTGSTRSARPDAAPPAPAPWPAPHPRRPDAAPALPALMPTLLRAAAPTPHAPPPRTAPPAPSLSDAVGVLWSRETARKDKGQSGHLDFSFQVWNFFNSSIQWASDRHPKQGQTDTSVQNNKGKNTKLKK